MNTEEKINLLVETLEIESVSITEDTLLSDIAEYDSMAKLSLIVLCDDYYSKKLTGEQIKEFKTVKDILDFMG